jgi:hypothetical protein
MLGGQEERPAAGRVDPTGPLVFERLLRVREPCPSQPLGRAFAWEQDGRGDRGPPRPSGAGTPTMASAAPLAARYYQPCMVVGLHLRQNRSAHVRWGRRMGRASRRTGSGGRGHRIQRTIYRIGVWGKALATPLRMLPTLPYVIGIRHNIGIIQVDPVRNPFAPGAGTPPPEVLATGG